MIGKAIYAWMKAEAGVTALIGSGDDTRCYPAHAPQGATYPYVVYSVVTDTPDREIDGRGGINRVNVQIDCYGGQGATGYSAAQNLAAAIHGTKSSPKLDGLYQQTLGSLFVHNAYMERKSNLEETPVDGSDEAIHRVTTDWVFWYDD